MYSGPRGLQYAQVLWKSSNKVGFGYAGAYVVARYCPNPKADTKKNQYAKYPRPIANNKPLGPTAYALNVCPIKTEDGKGGCLKCPPIAGLGYNNCFNDN